MIENIKIKTIKDKLTQDKSLIFRNAEKLCPLDNPAVVQTRNYSSENYSSENMGVRFPVWNDEKLEIAYIYLEDYCTRIPISLPEKNLNENPVDTNVSLLQDDAAREMALSMDKQIATALTTTPQVGTEIEIGTSNFIMSFTEACNKLLPYDLTAMVMTPETLTNILPTIHSPGSEPVWNADGSVTHPRFPDIPIFSSKNIALNDEKEGRILFVSNEATAAIKVEDKIDIYTYPNKEETGATIFQYNVFYCVKSNIKRIDNKNNGVVSVDVKW